MSIPEQVAIVSLEGMIKRAAIDVKRQLEGAKAGSEFKLTIEAKGRVHDGELKIDFGLADNDYSGPQVRGNRLGPVVEEFIRRNGWAKSHAPLQISQGEQNDVEF